MSYYVNIFAELSGNELGSITFCNTYTLNDLLTNINIRNIINNRYFAMFDDYELIYSNYDNSDPNFHLDDYKSLSFNKNMELKILKGGTLPDGYNEILSYVQEEYSNLGNVGELNGSIPVVMAAVQENSMAFYYASNELKKNKDVILAVVKRYGGVLQVVDKSFRTDREIVMAAVKNYGFALELASKDLRADRDIVLAAVRNHGLAIHYASNELKSDKEIVLTAVKNNRLALHYASEFLKQDKDILLAVA